MFLDKEAVLNTIVATLNMNHGETIKSFAKTLIKNIESASELGDVDTVIRDNEKSNNKTKTIIIDNIKMPDGWSELVWELKFDEYKKTHQELDVEEELPDAFYKDVISKMFKYGDFGKIEITVDEEFNIIQGKVIPNGNI